jgi:hypothetical protein
MNIFLKPLMVGVAYYTVFTIMAVWTFANNQTLGLIAIWLLFMSVFPFFRAVLKPIVDKAWEDMKK